jgi:hypothetical protein
MKFIGLGLVLVLVGSTVGSAASNEAVWRWSDGGTLHYSNLPDRVPSQAEEVKTRIGHEVASLPDVDVEDVKGDDARAEHAPDVFPHRVRKRLHTTYDASRLHFGCWASSVLYYGGWSHPDDIAPYYGCVPYHVGGPDAWLGAAKAELAIREHGLDLRQMVNTYQHSMKRARAAENVSDDASGRVRELSYSPDGELE